MKMRAVAAAIGLAVALAGCGLSLNGTGGSGALPDAAVAVDAAPDRSAPVDAGADVPACTAEVSKDPHNCGACGHDCLDGECLLGACQPVVFATGLTMPQGLAVDATSVFWASSSQGAIGRVPLAGGASSVLVSGAGQVQYVALGGTDLYWADRAAGNVVRRPLAGGAVSLLAGGQSTPTGIAVASGTVYFTAQTIDTLRAVLPDSGVVDVTPALDFPEGIAIEGSTVYVASPGGHVFAAPSDGGLPQVLVDGYGAEEPTGVAVEPAAVYFTLRKSGKVARFDRATGAIDVVASGQLRPTGITLDATAVYWANTGAGTIMRLAR